MNSCFAAAEEIKELNKEDPEWNDKVACMLKKMIHDEKHSIYHRVFLDLKYGPRKPRAFKKHVKGWVCDYVKEKVAIHKDFSERSYRKQIYGCFDWKKIK